MKDFLKKYGAMALNAVIISVSAFSFLTLAYFFEISDLFQGFEYAFFTYSAWAAIFAFINSGIVVVFEIRKLKGSALPKILNTFRLITATAAVSAALIFLCVLIPMHISRGEYEFLFSLPNVMLHIVTPAFVLTDWMIYADASDIKNYEALYGSVSGVVYCLLIYVAVPLGLRCSDMTAYPYFIMDPEIMGFFDLGNGKMGVVYLILISGLIMIGAAFALRAISKKLRKKQNLK